MIEPITAAVLTVSDRCAAGALPDTSGPALVKLLQESLGARVVATACAPDEADQIAAQLRAWALDDPRPDLILTTGGTGLSPRDVTPEATLRVLERRAAGLAELARVRGLKHTPLAFLSRGEAGTLGRTLVVNLPGARRGAVQSLEALLDVLPHAIRTLRGESDHADERGEA
jgi:molybdenum cofactor synthesis domain-containing protein